MAPAICGWGGEEEGVRRPREREAKSPVQLRHEGGLHAPGPRPQPPHRHRQRLLRPGPGVVAEAGGPGRQEHLARVAPPGAAVAATAWTPRTPEAGGSGDPRLPHRCPLPSASASSPRRGASGLSPATFTRRVWAAAPSALSGAGNRSQDPTRFGEAACRELLTADPGRQAAVAWGGVDCPHPRLVTGGAVLAASPRARTPPARALSWTFGEIFGGAHPGEVGSTGARRALRRLRPPSGPTALAGALRHSALNLAPP